MKVNTFGSYGIQRTGDPFFYKKYTVFRPNTRTMSNSKDPFSKTP